MSDNQNLTPQEKRELDAKEEKTIAGKFYVPSTDILESRDAITMAMEMPGVSKRRYRYQTGEAATLDPRPYQFR